MTRAVVGGVGLRVALSGPSAGVVGQACLVSLPFPEPGTAVRSCAGVFLGYLDYFRLRLVSKLETLPVGELRVSRERQCQD